MTQENSGSADEATQGRETASGKPPGLWWVEASIWTDRMVSALGNGVKGGKWPQFPNKSRPALTPHRFCGFWRLRRSRFRVVRHLRMFAGAHAESRHDRVQPVRVAPFSGAR